MNYLEGVLCGFLIGFTIAMVIAGWLTKHLIQTERARTNLWYESYRTLYLRIIQIQLDQSKKELDQKDDADWWKKEK